MLSLQGKELHYLIVGVDLEEKPLLQKLNLDNVADLKRLNALSDQHYKSVVLSYYNERKTLVPEGLYEKETEAKFLDFTYTDDLEKGIPTNDYIRLLASHLIYEEKEEINKIKAIFPELRIRHKLSVLLEAHMRSSIANGGIEVSVFGQEDKIEILVSDRNKLMLNNTFKVFNPEDFTYYVVYVMDVLGISIKETPVRIWGDVDEESIALLKKYCPKADFHKFSYDPNIARELTNEEYGRNAVLLNQYQCV